MSAIRALRPLLGMLLAVASVITPSAALQAQTAAAAYAPTCAPGTGCDQVRFTFTNAGPSLLEFVALRLASSNPAFAFRAIGPNAGTFNGMDALGPSSGATQVIGDGANIFVDFLTELGGAFTIAAGSSAYLEVRLTATPVLQPGVFSFNADLPADGRLAGSVSVVGSPQSTVPEPSTYALLATGLGTLGLIARRRRAA